MAKGGSRTNPRTKVSDASAQDDPPAQQDRRRELATELYTIIRLALEKFGLDDNEQALAFHEASRLREQQNVSGAVLRNMRGLSNLLREWSRSPDYLDRDGQARVLPIRGRGRTFESLAAQFLPSLSVDQVIGLATATAEVALQPRNRIALLGSILVNTTGSRQNLLAHTIRHIDQLLQTVLHNAGVHQGMPRSASGRMERMVLGLIKRGRFDDLMADLRPQLYEILLGVDASVEQRRPLTEADLDGATALSVGIYVSEEPDPERAGIDIRTALPAPNNKVS